MQLLMPYSLDQTLGLLFSSSCNFVWLQFERVAFIKLIGTETPIGTFEKLNNEAKFNTRIMRLII